MFTKLKVASAILSLVLMTPVAIGSSSESFGDNIVNYNITAPEVQSAQEAWGRALIQISTDYDSYGYEKAKATAAQIIDSAYGYKEGSVLFKPTLASGDQTFRTTREGALAYFVGGNREYPRDSGFALKSWRKFEYKNAAVYINGNMALTMGKVILTDKEGRQTTVDKTWGFKKDEQGKLKIVLHHSSLPYEP